MWSCLLSLLVIFSHAIESVKPLIQAKNDASGNNFTCPGVGLFPDPTDCSTYYHCLTEGENPGRTSKCPPSALFDSLENNCRPKATANCVSCKQDGYYRDNSNPSNYIQCHDGKATRKTCEPDGTIFNQEEEVCERPKKDSKLAPKRNLGRSSLKTRSQLLSSMQAESGLLKKNARPPPIVVQAKTGPVMASGTVGGQSAGYANSQASILNVKGKSQASKRFGPHAEYSKVHAAASVKGTADYGKEDGADIDEEEVTEESPGENPGKKKGQKQEEDPRRKPGEISAGKEKVIEGEKSESSPRERALAAGTPSLLQAPKKGTSRSFGGNSAKARAPPGIHIHTKHLSGPRALLNEDEAVEEDEIVEEKWNPQNVEIKIEKQVEILPPQKHKIVEEEYVMLSDGSNPNNEPTVLLHGKPLKTQTGDEIDESFQIHGSFLDGSDNSLPYNRRIDTNLREVVDATATETVYILKKDGDSRVASHFIKINNGSSSPQFTKLHELIADERKESSNGKDHVEYWINDAHMTVANKGNSRIYRYFGPMKIINVTEAGRTPAGFIEEYVGKAHSSGGNGQNPYAPENEENLIKVVLSGMRMAKRAGRENTKGRLSSVMAIAGTSSVSNSKGGSIAGANAQNSNQKSRSKADATAAVWRGGTQGFSRSAAGSTDMHPPNSVCLSPPCKIENRELITPPEGSKNPSENGTEGRQREVEEFTGDSNIAKTKPDRLIQLKPEKVIGSRNVNKSGTRKPRRRVRKKPKTPAPRRTTFRPRKKGAKSGQSIDAETLRDFETFNR